MFAILLAALVLAVYGSDVVVLTSANFEKLTQASTGSTTGDWLVEFYAPWCGHCKTLAPIYEQVATNLKGKINVAKVDIPANRDIGTRFDVKGFPTIKFLTKGNVYDYKGRRTAGEIETFALEGYKLVQPASIPEPVGMFGELTVAFKQAFAKAKVDFKKGNYFTADILLCFMPLLFVILVVVIIAMPLSDPSVNAKHKKDDDAAEEKDDKEDEKEK